MIEKNIKIFTPEKFAENIKEHIIIYTLIINRIDDATNVNESRSTRVKNRNAIKIFEAIIDYEDVFSERLANETLANGPQDHTIKINGKPLYDPLYSLSAIELREFREYLNNPLLHG